MAAGGGAGRWLCAAAALLQAAALGPSAAFSFSSSSASFSSISAGSPGELRSRVRVLGGSNWSLVLQGQWMVEL